MFFKCECLQECSSLFRRPPADLIYPDLVCSHVLETRPTSRQPSFTCPRTPEVLVQRTPHLSPNSFSSSCIKETLSSSLLQCPTTNPFCSYLLNISDPPPCPISAHFVSQTNNDNPLLTCLLPLSNLSSNPYSTQLIEFHLQNKEPIVTLVVLILEQLSGTYTNPQSTGSLHFSSLTIVFLSCTL